MTNQELQRKAAQIRSYAMQALFKSGSGFLGGTMSIVEILVALYYGEFNAERLLNCDPANPKSADQDYMILSKGHAAPAWYAVLADLGFFEVSELDFYRKPAALLTARPTAKVPGVALSTLSPGMGLGQAVGLATALKMERASNKVFVICGDAELQSGQFWEAAMAAAHYKLSNLVLIVDDNKQQEGGFVRSTMEIMPIQGKMENFGWQVHQVRDGHDYDQLFDGFYRAFRALSKPVCLWCHTTKGKGIQFAEGKPGYHNSVISDQEYANVKPKLESQWKVLV